MTKKGSDRVDENNIKSFDSDTPPDIFAGTLLEKSGVIVPGIGKTNHRSDASMKYLESAQEVDSEVFMKASVNVGVLAQTDAP